jgi:protoporphyrinogen oxidase
MSSDVLILGAGLAGLSCARHLGGGYQLHERETTAGGVARSFARGAFFFDVTGHWLHLRDPGIEKLAKELLGDELVVVQRRAEIHSHGVRTPYPFQANTYGLPPAVVAECVLGYFAAREAEARGGLPPPASFEDYIRRRMGDGIAKHFMIPYNTKLFTVPPSEMSHEWCGRFVPIPTPDEVVRGALAPAGAGHGIGYNATFLYPREGGIGRLAAALEASLPEPARKGSAAVKVDPRARSVTFADGSRASYRVLVSTLPLKALVALIDGVPDAVRHATAQLRATNVTYWDVGVKGANAPGDAHWIYFPEPELPFYRAGSASAAVPSLAPAGHRSYYVEVSHAGALRVGDAEVLAGMRRAGLLGPREEPVLMHHTTVEGAYVIMDHAYGPARATVLEWLTAQGILSVGRYGAWTYDSMEGAMVQGRDAAARARSMLGAA